MVIFKQEILHNKYCQQQDHAAVLSLLNHIYFESFSSQIILFLLYSTVMFFLYCMLNILKYEKIFREIDESITSQYSDVIFLGVHSESIFPVMDHFFSSRKLCFLQSPCLLLIAESISLDTSGKPAKFFFIENYFSSLLNNIGNLT